MLVKLTIQTKKGLNSPCGHSERGGGWEEEMERMREKERVAYKLTS